MKELTIINQEGKLLVDSREVAEMVGKEHSNLMRDIRGYEKIVSENSNLNSQDFFIKSNYKVLSNNKVYVCYLLTKKGCDMVANKMTGEKGILFTAEYVTKFEEMEKQINGQAPKQLTALQQLQLQNQAILEVNEKVERIENDMPLFKAECDELQALVRKAGIKYMGGKSVPAYKDNSIRGKVYSDIQNQLKREFGVNKYAWIKHSQFNQAKEIVNAYKLPTALKNEIEEINNQINFESEAI